MRRPIGIGEWIEGKLFVFFRRRAERSPLAPSWMRRYGKPRRFRAALVASSHLTMLAKSSSSERERGVSSAIWDSARGLLLIDDGSVVFLFGELTAYLFSSQDGRRASVICQGEEGERV